MLGNFLTSSVAIIRASNKSGKERIPVYPAYERAVKSMWALIQYSSYLKRAGNFKNFLKFFEK